MLRLVEARQRLPRHPPAQAEQIRPAQPLGSLGTDQQVQPAAPHVGVDQQRTVGAGLDSQRSISEIVMAMRRCPQPIIACIDGAASGGGFALALASDVRIATPRSRMNAAFIRIGLSACDIGVSYFLPRLVGASVAA
mgnify:CR=1 FL=1